MTAGTIVKTVTVIRCNRVFMELPAYMMPAGISSPRKRQVSCTYLQTHCWDNPKGFSMEQTLNLQRISQREADICFALSDPTRIMILHALENQPKNVTELTSELGITQPTTSHHLKILRDRSLLRATRHGGSVTYALSDPRLLQALNLLQAVLLDQFLVL